MSNITKILIVDDHPGMLSAVSMLLRDVFPHCTLLVASNAKLAVALSKKHAPEIVILDIFLPDMSGIDAIALIQAAVPGVKIVMHSSHDSQSYRIKAALAGADAFIAKKRSGSELPPLLAQILAEFV